jgi:hypothetical protein
MRLFLIYWLVIPLVHGFSPTRHAGRSSCFVGKAHYDDATGELDRRRRMEAQAPPPPELDGGTVKPIPQVNTEEKSFGDVLSLDTNDKSIKDVNTPDAELETSLSTAADIDQTNESRESPPSLTTAKQEVPFEVISGPQRLESVKCLLLGAGVGIFALMPFTAFHYFVYQPEYTSVPQWEFDTYTSAVQGALFCLAYRFTVREKEPSEISQLVVRAFVGVRTLSRIRVPMRCTAFPLYCTCTRYKG